MTAIGDMVSEEIRDRLDRLPYAILRLAARRPSPGQCITVYEDEWLPELTYILKGDEARPVTRPVHGTRYAIGILASTRRIARHLDRPLPGQPAAESKTPADPRPEYPWRDRRELISHRYQRCYRNSTIVLAVPSSGPP